MKTVEYDSYAALTRPLIWPLCLAADLRRSYAARVYSAVSRARDADLSSKGYARDVRGSVDGNVNVNPPSSLSCHLATECRRVSNARLRSAGQPDRLIEIIEVGVMDKIRDHRVHTTRCFYLSNLRHDDDVSG